MGKKNWNEELIGNANDIIGRDWANLDDTIVWGRRSLLEGSMRSLSTALDQVEGTSCIFETPPIHLSRDSWISETHARPDFKMSLVARQKQLGHKLDDEMSSFRKLLQWGSLFLRLRCSLIIYQGGEEFRNRR